MKRIDEIYKTPNLLTLSRIALTPIIIVFLLSHNKFTGFFAALFFSIAAITDYFDGYLARQSKNISSFGKVMDPVADKILVSSSYIMLASHNIVPAWVVCIIIGREFFVTTLRILIVEKNKNVAASNLGKYKTGFQIASIIPLMLYYPYFGINMYSIGTVMLVFALFFTIWSGVDYLKKFKDLIEL